jgi:hypothetical protein
LNTIRDREEEMMYVLLAKIGKNDPYIPVLVSEDQESLVEFMDSNFDSKEDGLLYSENCFLNEPVHSLLQMECPDLRDIEKNPPERINWRVQE